MKRLLDTDTHTQKHNSLFSNLIDRKELATRLGISVSYVDKLLGDEEIPCVRIGRTVRFEYSEVVTSLKNRRRSG